MVHHLMNRHVATLEVAVERQEGFCQGCVKQQPVIFPKGCGLAIANFDVGYDAVGWQKLPQRLPVVTGDLSSEVSQVQLLSSPVRLGVLRMIELVE